MTKLVRSMSICYLFLGVLLLEGTSRAQTRSPMVEQLAKTYGLDSYGQIEAVRYTFNLELPALKVTLARTWTWEPKTGQVTYETKDKDGKPVEVTYNRSQLEIPSGSWRLHARRHLGSLRRQGWASGGIYLSSRRPQEAQ
jgi:hypothetical protein